MSEHRFSQLALVIACFVTLGHALMLRAWMLDDAFIFFRYAENWVEGHGLRFNAGEAAVEGYSSFLWVALLAAGHLCNLDTVVWSLILGYACAAGTLVLVHQSWRWVQIDRRTASHACLLLGTCGAFTPWPQSGMETSLHALLVTALLLGYLHAKGAEYRRGRWIRLGLLAALVCMNRPDGALVVMVVAADAWLLRAAIGRRPLELAAATVVLVFGSYFVWRWSYYGYLFPNTFYAKVGSTWAQVQRGFGYVFGSVFALLPLLLLPASVGRGWRNADRDYLVIPALLVVFTGYIVLVGGDVMPAYRFFSPLVPVMALLAAMTLTTHREEVRTPVVIGCVLFNLMMVLTSVTPSIRGDVVAHNGTVAGRWLRIHAPKGAVLAANSAGALVYYSRMRAIDMLGLNDSHIAHRKVEGMGKGHSGHEKGDGAYVLSRRPEFIQLGSSLGWVPTKVMPDPPFPGDRELWNNPEFRSGYHLYYKSGPTRWPGGERCGLFGFYVRNDVFEALTKAGK